MIDRQNLNASTLNINQFICEKVTNTEFQNNYFGSFQCGKSVNANPAKDIPVFQYSTTIPHYQRSIRTDMVYMESGSSKAIIVIKPDDQAEVSVTLNSANTRLQVDCTDKGQNSNDDDIDQFYRISITYQKQSINTIRLAFDSTCSSSKDPISRLRISGIQINISPCHPSCQTCNGPLENNCLSCSVTSGATLSGGKCSCNDQTNVIQYGVCQKTCDAAQFLFQSNKICVFIPNCQQNNGSQCQKCNSGFFLADGLCYSNCPAGYLVLPDNKCSHKFANINGQQYVTGLLYDDFSMISISKLGVVMSNYLQQNSEQSQYSRCNKVNYLGGFFINQMNTTITFPQITNTYKQVSVSFKYIFVDYESTGDSGVTVEVIIGSQSAKDQILTTKTGQINICGLSKIDIVGVYEKIFELPQVGNFIVKITNQNKNSNFSSSSQSRNEHAYFGIREIDVFGFDCKIEYCLTCSGLSCSKCIDGYFLQSNTCQTCKSSCATCSNATSCSTCRANFTYNISTNECVCNEGYYLSNNDCLKCTNNLCKTCLPATPSTCTSCLSPKVLGLNKQCLDKCPSGQYVDANQSCQTCSNTSCLTCDPLKPSKCLTCSSPNFLINENCELKCPEKYYENTTLRQCIACSDPTCKKCNPAPDNKCTECYAPKVLQNGKCLDTCGNGYYLNISNQSCLSCSGICKECQPQNPSFCISCYPPLVPNAGTCDSSCGNKKYQDSNGVCQNCQNSSCLLCDQNSPDKCLSCDGSNYLYNGNCVPDCIDQGTYKNDTDKECKNCPDSNCLQCDQNNPSFCQKCAAPTGLLGNQCVLNCGDSKYINSLDQICTPCPDNNCQTCEPSDPTKCLICQSTHVLQGSNCQTDCQDGYYSDQNKTCQECSNKTCKTCSQTDSTICLSCQPDKVFFISTCEANCPDNYYQSSPSNICIKCPDQNCKTCNATLPSNDCQTCISPYVLQDSVCVLNCKEGYYVNSLQICQQCSNINCQHCDQFNSNTCLSCESKKVLHQGDCIDNCPSEYYKNPITGQCLKCISTNCDVCDPDIQDICLTCLPTHLNQEGKCVTACSQNYYYLGQQCLACENKSCLSCDPNDPQICLTCSEDKEIQLSSCVNKCQDFEVYDTVNKKCIKCLNNCLTCELSSPSTCNSCQYPNVLNHTECKTECDEGMYIDNNLNKCLSCLNPLCSTCNPFNSSECISCKTPKILFGTDCVDSCQNNMYVDTSNNSCQICSNPQQNCKTCQESNPLICISCVSPLALLGDDCVTNCGDGFVKNTITDVCEQCSTNCKRCDLINKNQCISCEPPLVLLESSKQCLRNCPDGMYTDSAFNVCKDCTDTTCKTCLESSPSKCQSCDLPLHLQNDQCKSQCDKGNYLSDALNQCLPCQNPGNNCLTCDKNQPQKCVSCESPKALWQGNCVDTCDNGYVIDTNNQTCVKCQNNNCLTCSFPGTLKCLSCGNQKMIDNDDCVDKCKFGYYFDASTQACEMCKNSKCQYCDPSDSNICTECQSPKIKKGQDCVDSCGDNMYIDILTNTCMSCTNKNNNCQTCLNPPNQNICTSCSDPFTLLNSNCVKDCGSGKVKDPITRICKDCTNKNCSTCSLINKDQCLTCPSDKYLLNGDCVSNCGDNMFDSNKICIPCQEKSCSTCLPHSLTCTSCSTPKYLLNGLCLDDCGDNWYKSLVSQVCLKCKNPNCKTCDLNDSNICLSCTNPKLLDEKDCVDYCGDNKFFDTSKNQCQSCLKHCKKCEDDVQCIECQSGYFKHRGVCVVNCPKEKFYEDKSLSQCIGCKDNNCIDCLSDKNSCLKCMTGYSLTSSQSSNLKECQKCENPDCEDTKVNPPKKNEVLQQSLSASFSIISIFAGILSPFYLLVSFFDLLQVTNYLVFINANYSSNLYTFLQLFSFANFEIIPNVKNSNSNAPQKFKNENLDTFLFSNLIQVFSIWITSYILYGISVLVKPQGKNLISSFINYYRNNYKYNIMIGIGFLTYCDIALSVFLQLYDLENMQTLQIVGLIFSFGFICLLFGLNVVTFYVTQKSISNINLRQFDKFFNEGFNRKKLIVNLVFLVRKTLIIYILVFKQLSPIYQSLQIFLILGIETTTVIAIKPFKIDKEYKLNVIGRILLLLSLVSIIALSFYDGINSLSESLRTFLEALVMVMLAVLFVSQLGYIFYSIVKKKQISNQFNLLKKQQQI